MLTQIKTPPTEIEAAVDEQAQQSQQLAEHLEEVAQVTGRLAHDFSNVLTGILGFSELALNHMPGDSPTRRFVREAWDSAQRGAEWIQKLHLFSRRGPNQPPATAVAPVAQAEQARLAPEWGSGISLRVEVPEFLPPAAIPAELLRRILVELLDNARRAISGVGSVTLSAREVNLEPSDCRQYLGALAPGHFVELSVRDTGSGLTQERLNAAFATLFSRGKSRQSGLGLAVVYGVARAHRGGLRLKPVSPPGTHFCVCLPTAPSTE
jgi:signal transduction histidine kinase